MITSSDSLRWKRVERNSGPSTGRSPRPGTLSRLLRVVLEIRPPIAKLWPLPSSTVVSARRVDSAGNDQVVQLDRTLVAEVADLRAGPAG